MAAFLFDTHDGFQYTVTFEPVNAYQIFIGLQQHFVQEFGHDHNLGHKVSHRAHREKSKNFVISVISAR